MNNRVCLNPDIEWHGTPKVMRADGFRGIRVEKTDGVLTVTVSMVPKRMSRKRLVKLLMAHGMMARSAKSVEEEYTREGWPHTATYAFVIEKMHEFIDMQNKQGGEKDEPVQQSVPPMEAAQDL